ncbi:MAG TPA: hypothetical protein VFZ21_07460 [Gemmatimonadaceae bacterium]|nr:hypothetical protein [Gemmatimonadaceae bacterium]
MDDQRVYSDEEFAVILRKAAELANRPEAPAASAGLTLSEMKAAAAQVGFDPALVERAARLVATSSTASPLQRLAGGPLRHHHKARFPIQLDEDTAARLLSAVRINATLAGQQDVGHASSLGMTWHDGGDMESLRITARPEENGTTVSVALDRRGTLTTVAAASGVVMFLAVLFSASALYPEAPALGVGGLIAGIGGVLAAARGYWASSTKKVQERIGTVMDAIEQTLSRPEPQISGHRKVGDGAAAPEADPSVVGDAELTGT